MRKMQNDTDIETQLEYGEEPLNWRSFLLSSYDQWKGSNVLSSQSMTEHMKELISREYPWLLMDYIKQHSTDEVI